MSSGFSKLYRSSYPLSLEKSLIERIQQHKKINPLQKVNVIVPNHYVGAHLRHELANHQTHMNVATLTIKDFARSMLSTHQVFLKKKELFPEMELYCLANICKTHLKGSEFEDVCNKRGFHKNLRNFFHHLIQEEGDRIPSVNAKTKLFDAIFSSYLKLKTKYHHGLWNIELAKLTDLKIDAPILVYGFSQFTKLERSFLSNIAKAASLEIWMEVFSTDNFQVSTLMWLDQNFQNVEDLEEQEAEAQIHAQTCHHIHDESLWIAHAIAERQKSNPIPFHRFGVFLNDDSQRSHIENALNRYGIPHVYLYGNKLHQSRLGQSIQRFIELIGTNWSRNDWFDFLSTLPFDQSFYLVNGDPSDWNQFSIEAGLSTRDAFWMKRIETLPNLDSAKKIPSFEKIPAFISFQKKMFSEVMDLEKIIEKKDFASFANELNKFFQTYVAREFLTPAMLMFFSDLEYLLSDVDMNASFIDIQRMILERLESASEKGKTFESDGVLIAPFSMMKSLFFDVIFLPHMNEGCFPKNEVPLFDLHVDELKKISEKSKISFDHSQKQLDIQSSMLDSVKYHAHESIYLSYSKYSLPGEQDLKPSLLIHPWLENQPIFEPGVVSNSNVISQPAFEKIRAWVSSDQSNTWDHFKAYVDSKNVRKEAYSATELSRYAECPKRYFFANVLGLSKEEYLEHQPHMMAKDRGTLIHEILFRFFIKLKSQNLIPMKKENRQMMLDLLRSTATETFTRYQTLNSYGITDLWKNDENELFSDLTAYLDQELREASYWIPYSFEYRFGMPKFTDQEDDPHSSEKPISLPLAGKKLLFKGRVDRIDLSPDQQQLRIIDYKTGKLFSRKTSWSYEKGVNLQIPLYILLSDQFFSKKPEHAEGKLVSLQAITKFEQRRLDKSELLSKQDQLFSHLELLDQGIQDGIFFPNPENGGSNCTYCDFLQICGKNIHQTVEKIEPTDFMNRFFDSKKALS